MDIVILQVSRVNFPPDMSCLPLGMAVILGAFAICRTSIALPEIISCYYNSVGGGYVLCKPLSEASPTLGCSIEISRDIYMCVSVGRCVCRVQNLSSPPLYFVFENSKNPRNDLARPVMGTIFLVILVSASSDIYSHPLILYNIYSHCGVLCLYAQMTTTVILDM